MAKIEKKRIGILVSGGGSNLQSIIDNIESGNLNCEISYVIADRPCHGLERAQNHKIRNIMLDRKLFGANLSDEINLILESDEKKTDYIILAGYLSILTEKFIKKWENRIINIHPSLLPKYGGFGMYGMNVHREVFKNKETESGCTVHYVTENIDAGNIIDQEKIDITSAKSPEEIQKMVLEKEWILLPRIVKKLIEK